MKYYFNNTDMNFLYISTIEVLKNLKVIKESNSDEFYYQIKKIDNKNEFNRIALNQYKNMYGILPMNKTSYFRLISYILKEDCIDFA